MMNVKELKGIDVHLKEIDRLVSDSLYSLRAMVLLNHSSCDYTSVLLFLILVIALWVAISYLEVGVAILSLPAFNIRFY